MSTEQSDIPAPIYVPVALSELEAVAVKSACAAVITGTAPLLSRDHPLISGALKIEDAWREATGNARDRRSA